MIQKRTENTRATLIHMHTRTRAPYTTTTKIAIGNLVHYFMFIVFFVKKYGRFIQRISLNSCKIIENKSNAVHEFRAERHTLIELS